MVDGFVFVSHCNEPKGLLSLVNAVVCPNNNQHQATEIYYFVPKVLSLLWYCTCLMKVIFRMEQIMIIMIIIFLKLSSLFI